MAKDRKLHRQAVRLRGIAQRKKDAAAAEHQRNLLTLQKVLDHTDALRAKNPDLFAAMMQSVNDLAVANGVSANTIMQDGVLVKADDGSVSHRGPQQILHDIAEAHSAFNRRGAHVIDLDALGADVDPASLGGVELAAPPSIERQREAHAAVQSGLKSLDLNTCSDIALQEAMSMGYEPATTEWLRRHPEAEASDGGRLG